MLSFLTTLKTQVQGMTHTDLVGRIVAYAETIPADQRKSFLRHFTLIEDADDSLKDSAPDADLLADIEAFAEAVRSQKYVDNWDWDLRTDEIIVTGDKSWVDDMQDLFTRTDNEFATGNFAVAASAYPTLLSLFTITAETGEGYFPGDSDPYDMIDINFEETAARYLRSLIASDADIDTFLIALERMYCEFTYTLTLTAIMEASSQPLAYVDQLFDSLEPALRERLREPTNRIAPDWHKLLREVIVLRSGTDGLGVLAHEQGRRVPDAYYEWLLALRKEGRYDEAIAAARDAVHAVEIPKAKGVLATALGIMLDEQGAAADAWQAKLCAWQSYPSLNNLTSLLKHGHAAMPEILTRIDMANSLWQQQEIDFSPLEYTTSTMRILFQGLTGNFDQIARELSATSGVGWSYQDHNGYPSYTLTLLTLFDPSIRPPSGSILATLMKSVEQRATSDVLQLLPAPDDNNSIDHMAVLQARLFQKPLEDAQRNSYREIVRKIMLRRVESIVSAQHRKAYERAAQAAVAYAETMLLEGQSMAALALYHEVVARYPRHSAFRAAMHCQWKESSVTGKIHV